MTRVMQRLNMSGGIMGGHLVADDFNRADNPSMGASWLEIEPAAAFSIAGNRCRINIAQPASARWNPALGNEASPTQSSRGLLATNNVAMADAMASGLAVRLAPDGATQRGYGFILRHVGGAAHRTLVRFSDLGGMVVLADELGDFPVLQSAMASMSGALLQGYLFTAGSWVLRLEVIDATYGTGQPGFVTPIAGVAGGQLEWENWEGGPTAGAVILGRRRAQYITSGAFRPRVFRRNG